MSLNLEENTKQKNINMWIKKNIFLHWNKTQGLQLMFSEKSYPELPSQKGEM